MGTTIQIQGKEIRYQVGDDNRAVPMSSDILMLVGLSSLRKRFNANLKRKDLKFHSKVRKMTYLRNLPKTSFYPNIL